MFGELAYTVNDSVHSHHSGGHNLLYPETVTSLLANAYPALVSIYIHGSMVKGNVHANSDLDLALLFTPGFTPARIDLLLFSADLESLIGRNVDIGVLSLDNVVYAKEVLTGGRRIYCRDTMACETFEMYVFSFYAKLNDERWEVLASYQG